MDGTNFSEMNEICLSSI